LQQQQQLDLQRKAMEMVGANTPAVAPPAVPIPPSPVLTAAEKKARNQAMTQAQVQHQVTSQMGSSQDIYEFHEDAGEEPKGKANSAVAPPAEDQRPRLILTINKTQPSIKNSNEVEQPVQQQQQQPDVASQIDPIGGDNSESSNTRKSRRLQEKEDRSTVDDIIEDVVRNTNTPTGAGQQLPKGAQTPPRRSGRNAQAKKTDAVHPANAVGRPRRSKDRKTIGEPPASLMEETIAPNPTGAAPTSNLLPPPEAVNVQPHMPQLDGKEVEPVQDVAPIPTLTPVAVSVPVSVPAPAPAPVMVLPKPTMPQHPKKKAIAAAEIESYQAINSSIPSGGLPMHQTAAPATQKITGGAADAVSKALTPSASVNSSNDHDTEDETETRQLPPAKPVVPTVGRPPGRGGSAKRGRQPRGAKKVGGFPLNAATARIAADLGLVLQPGDNGVQTRLRKPVTAPVTRGRKGRPPRNLLLQQQQQLDLQRKAMEMVGANTPAVAPPAVPIPPSPVLTAAEKKARNQAMTQAQVQHQVTSQMGSSQDIYEFHEDAGEEPKGKANSAVAPPAEDQRPRLILTINKTQPSIKNSNEVEQPVQQQQQQPDVASQIDPIGGDNSESSNTRKSRRLQEKEDRSTVDDIIEDVVRNTNTPTGAGQQLPKGAQTPPRRSGRNAQAKKTDAVHPANAVGRPRRSKDRKTIGEPPASLMEETIAPNPTGAAPTSNLLPPPEAVNVQPHIYSKDHWWGSGCGQQGSG